MAVTSLLGRERASASTTPALQRDATVLATRPDTTRPNAVLRFAGSIEQVSRFIVMLHLLFD